MFKALLLSKEGEAFDARIADLDDAQLPEGDVVLRVSYSTVNFKDALALTNSSPIVRKWPMVAGIDAAGVVDSSRHPGWNPGESVILNGWGVGESHWGGLAQRMSVKRDLLVEVPQGMTLRPTMAIGTAGYTALACAMALERLGAT